jgi:hypothetical protein
LEEALAALAARGVAPLVLPGAALDLVDLDVDLGCHNDVDLMLERDRIEQALGVLGPLGYTVRRHERTPGATLRFEKTLTLTRSAGIAIRLALRWQLFDSPNRAAQRGHAWLRATTRRISIGAAPALTLGPEAQLLHLAGHLARHDRNVELRWLDDIAALLAAPGEPIDYPLLFRRASEWDVVEPLRASLLAVDADWHALLPPDARHELLALRPSDAAAGVKGSISRAFDSV